MTAAIHEPDAMGAWSDYDETVWLPRTHYPKRSDAIAWAVKQWGVGWTEVRCLYRWMRYDPHVVGAIGDNVDTGWTEDRWNECEPDAEGAFRVWRLETAS